MSKKRLRASTWSRSLSSTGRPTMNDRSQPSLRYPAAALNELASTLLARAGVRADIGSDVADVLVGGDLMGHTTHGLALLPGYLGEIERGAMAKSGAPSIVTARPAAQAWDCARSTSRA
jgi:LDH2 family malate/lactate/ureidoglycolate dehydrogenase